MHEAALEIDGNRARARWSAPGQVLLPVLTQSGRECWPMLLADAGRSVVTDEDAVRVARGEPGRVVGDFLHGLGTSRRFEAGGLTVDAAEALRLVLLAVKRRQPPRAETALGFPAYLDDTGATVRPTLTDGVFNTPHGIATDGDGNVYVSEWVIGGRLIKLERVP